MYLGGIMSDMENFLGDQVAKAYEKDPIFEKLNNSNLKRVNADQSIALDAKQSYVLQLQQEISQLKQKLAEEQQKANRYKKQKQEASQVDAYYEDLLSKPLEEIAETNGNFMVNYEKKMEVMAEWMVSQKAFKELAIQFGFEMGHSAEETIAMANDKKIDVLDNKHNPEHGSNANGLPFLEERSTKIRKKLLDKN
jgi:hypothetical protein